MRPARYPLPVPATVPADPGLAAFATAFMLSVAMRKSPYMAKSRSSLVAG
jgi:hypothetical protein